MTLKDVRDYTVAAVIFFPTFAMACDAGTVLLERPISLFNAHRYGNKCMELVDPTASLSSQLSAVDPEMDADLANADPAAHAFLHSHPMVSVTILDGPTYRGCFGVSRSNNQAGTDAVFLNSALLPSPALRAVSLAHELVHVEHSHPDTPQGQHSILRHLLISEEGEAHLADQQAAINLHTEPLDTPGETYLFDVFPLPIAFLLCLLATYVVRSLIADRKKVQSSTL